jgi:hypothetical protein
MDRKRAKAMSNQEWINPADPETEITRLKDGRTALAYQAEQAVGMESGAILAVTTHAGSVCRPATLQQTVCEAGVAVSELLAELSVNASGVQEVIADKGYHSNDTMLEKRGIGTSARTSPSRNEDLASGRARGLSKRLFTETAGAFSADEASGCWRKEEKRSSGTSRINSTLVAWTGFT